MAGVKREKEALGRASDRLALALSLLAQGSWGPELAKGGGERTAGGFVSAAGLQILHEMEGAVGVSGAACVGCSGCYWVGEAGDRRIPPPGSSERALPSHHKGQVLGTMAASTVRAAADAERRRTHTWPAASRF